MALETASYIHQLNAANPSGADRIHQGDDHIRMLKAVLKATFPNFTGPLTLSQDELVALKNGLVPVGIISAWYGAASAVPAGWAICNGQTVARSDGTGDITTPNLVNRAIVGAGGDYAVGDTFGAKTASATTGTAGAHTHTIGGGGAHTHTGQVQGHALTEAQLPAHKHANGVVDKNDNLFNHGGLPANPTRGDSIDGNSSSGTREGYTSTVGGGQAHSHGLTIDSSTHTHTISENDGAHSHSVQVSTLSPSGALHFIMKV